MYSHAKASCKCHGVSDSCSLKTCWNQLPSFREVGDRLMSAYDAAREVSFNNPGSFLVRKMAPPSVVQRQQSTGGGGGKNSKKKKIKRGGGDAAVKPSKEELLFVAESPDYCAADAGSGTLGTRGRQCLRSALGHGGCDTMCCGRGYNTQRTRVSERCQCKFHWCCYVKCSTCEQTVDIDTCK